MHSASRSVLTSFIRPIANAALAVACATPALAEGIRSPTIGSEGLGSSGGRRVFADDASAAFQQPANLVELDRWEVSFEPTIAYHSAHFTGATGATAETKDPVKFLPNFFVGGPLIKDKLALGLAVTTPFGLSVSWKEDGALRDRAPYFGELQTVDIGPSLAFRLAPGFTASVGFDAMWSSLELRDYLPPGLFPGAGVGEINVRGKGDGTGYGGNASITWEFISGQRLAATVRLPMDVNYSGDSHYNYVNALGPVSQSSSFSSKIPFPTIVSFGYGIELPHDVRLEADGEWLQFSRFQQLPLDAPTAISFGPGVSIPFNLPAAVQNWRDTFTAGAGASWHFSEHWTLRGGYEYFQTPAPDATFNPIIPDADQHAVTIGLGMRSGHHRLNLSYGHVFYLDRTINASNQPGTPYAGKFEVDVHLMSVAYGYSF